MLDIQNLGIGSPKKENRENERETFINEEIKEMSLNWRVSVSRLKRTTEWSTKTRPTSSSPLSSTKMDKYIQLFTTLDNRQSRNIIPDRRENSARAALKFTSFLSGNTSPTIVQRSGGTFIYHWTEEADMEVWNCWQVLEGWLSTQSKDLKCPAGSRCFKRQAVQRYLKPHNIQRHSNLDLVRMKSLYYTAEIFQRPPSKKAPQISSITHI